MALLIWIEFLVIEFGSIAVFLLELPKCDHAKGTRNVERYL